jgi:hypothetical protein
MRIGVQNHIVGRHWLHYLLSLHNKESASLSSMVFALPVERGFAVR